MPIESQMVRFDSLRKQLDNNAMRRVRLEEKLRAATSDLQRTVAEVRAAGYDPRTLEEVKVEKEKELSDAIDRLAAQVAIQTDALSAIEAEAE